MRSIEIDEDNSEDFSDYIDEDMIDNMDRTFFRGIGATDDDDTPLGALVFELKNSESEEDTTSRIHSFKAENDEAKELILSEYEKLISEEDVVESFYELADEETAKLLKAGGFSFETSEYRSRHAGYPACGRERKEQQAPVFYRRSFRDLYSSIPKLY